MSEGVGLPQPPELLERDFLGFQRLIYREAGIWMAPGKRALLVGRLSRRLHELGGLSFAKYLRLAEADGEERTRLLDAICTHETHFFREPRHFEILQNDILPRWVARGYAGEAGRQVRVWSAGCSTGEEPFSLAMLLRFHLPPEWSIDILATDLSTRILERARQTLWPLEKAREIPEPYLKAFMLKGTGSQEGRMKAGPELRALVRFQHFNLNSEQYPPGGFDLIFCRNVLIYFDAASKLRVIDQLLDRLSPQGLLFLGHAESLNGVTQRVRTVMPTVYAPVPARPGTQAPSRG